MPRSNCASTLSNEFLYRTFPNNAHVLTRGFAYRHPPSQNSIDHSSSSHGKPPYTSSGLNATTVSIGSSFGQLRLSKGKPTCSSETASQASEMKTPDSTPQCSSFGLIDDHLSVTLCFSPSLTASSFSVQLQFD
ncbi:hypothetical protein F2Q70_00006768 [Brassica cretica]|uniref:Uncharacterized protein n=1 Tax=Brassica cretica TaxID=69181 RepID=A0A8S9J380_BRACR|nr:hypothetical protein F2Q70_00006768 [Brassica cretica]